MSCEETRHPTLESTARSIAKATEEGLIVVYADDCSLLLDIDSAGAREHALEMIGKFAGSFKLARVEETRSKSGNWHLYVRLSEPMERQDRMFWQAALGSDPVRAALDWIWFREGYQIECFLYEKPGATYEVIPESDYRT